MWCNIIVDREYGYFTLNKALKCVSYRLSKPRLNFLSLVFGQCVECECVDNWGRGCLPHTPPAETKSLRARPPVIFTWVPACSVVFTHNVNKLAVLPSKHLCIWLSAFLPFVFSTKITLNLNVDSLIFYIVFSLCLSFVQLPLLIFSLSFWISISFFLSLSLSPCSLSLHVPDNSCDLYTWRLVLEVWIGQYEVS
jgi:hypothetical protein